MSDIQEPLAALWASHDRLDAATHALTADAVTAPSYCTDWTIAQVLSHLGSGGQLFELRLDAGLAGTEPPGQEESQKVWDVWNAMEPLEQVQDSLATDSAFLQRIDGMPPAELDSIHMALGGMEVDAADLLRMRLSEHAIHTWDVLVMNDPSAQLPPDAAALMVHGMGLILRFAAKAEGEPVEADIMTTDPALHLRLSVSDAVTLGPAGSDAAPATSTVHMPAEALVRLAYGRLDPDHTPASVTTDGVDLDRLRAVFPGL